MLPSSGVKVVAGVAASAAAAVLAWRVYRASRPPPATAASVLAEHGGSLAGKRVLVTGACTGLGFALAKSILEECKVEALLFHGRSELRVAEAVARLPAHLQSLCIPIVADLSSLREVDAMAGILNFRPPAVVICCAGVATLPDRTATKDGYEMQFAVNHLSHFHLVSSMLHCYPHDARVVLVSSDLHQVGGKYLTLDLDNLNSQLSYSWFGAYIASKYCNVLCARGLARHGIQAVSCSPGAVATDIDRYLSAPLRFCFRFLGPGLFAKSPEEGAATLAFCATAPVTPGGFYAECKALELKGAAAEEQSQELWVASEELIAAALKS